jgi:predicted nucleotidyltransferase
MERNRAPGVAADGPRPARRGAVAFDQVDPFNGNRVRGFIRRSKRRRGDLEITHVNGERCEQYIYCTPSIANLAVDSVPPAFERVEVFEKLDGTNVLLFHYQDAGGRRFVSYKTRSAPFLGVQAYGDFLALWRAMLDRYAAEIATLVESPCSFGFELFGRELPMLTGYETRLDARLLYALEPATGKMIAPRVDPAWRFPTPASWGDFPEGSEVSEMVRDTVARAARQLDGGAPVEGAVLYFVHGGRAVAYKCKPAVVLESQARYRELYARGKATARTDGRAEAVIDDIRAHVAEHWDAQVREREHRAIDLACDHLRKELAYEDAAAGASAVRRSDGSSERDDTSQLTVLWSAVWGSHMWGMAGPSSDTDRCIVYQVEDRTLVLGAFERELLRPHQRGFHRKPPGGDEHWYEIGRVVQLLLGGSVTMLYGVMSPLVDAPVAAHGELRSLLEQQPSRVFYRALMRDVGDSEIRMRRALDEDFHRKHLRIACRNLQFAITLFAEGRYEFRPSEAVDARELAALREQLAGVNRSSRLPERFDPRPFHDYLVRWRRMRSRMDEHREEWER